MKKRLIPFAALAMLALGACSPAQSSTPAPEPSSEPTPSSSVAPSSDPSSEPSSESVSISSEEPVTYSVSITNKESLQAEWHMGEASRAVELELSPKGNILDLLEEGTLKIESDHPEFVAVSGRQLQAIAVGSAIITVTYGDATDTVEVSVQDKLGNPDIVVGKTLTELMAVPTEDLYDGGNNKYGKEAYAIKVKVVAVGNKADGSASADKYGNIWVVEPDAEEGTAPVQVYGSGASMSALTFTADGYYKYANAQDFLVNEDTAGIKAGDIIDVIAFRADYKTTPEISCVIRAINDVVIANAKQTTDEVLATELTNEVAQTIYSVKGVITALGSKADGSNPKDKYGNMYIKTEGAEGEVLQVYGSTLTQSALTITDGAPKFTNPKDFLTNETTNALAVGDEITIKGIRCDYQGKIEICGVIVKSVEPAVEPEHVQASIADLLAKTAEENNVLYEVSGIWEKGKGDDYGNGYLTDPATGDSITVYGATATATAIAFDGSSGSPVYTFTNPKDAKTTLADLHDGDLVYMTVLNAYYAAQSLPEIKGIVTKIEESTNKYAVVVDSEIVGGTVEASKTADVAYGEDITLTVTPDEGKKVSKVTVEDAFGKKTTIAAVEGVYSFKATCVNKVSAEFEDDTPVTPVDPSESVSVTFTAGTDKGTQTGQTTDTITKDGITLTDNNSPLGNDDNYRIYKNQSLVVSIDAALGKIVKVTFTCTAEGTAKYGPGCFTVEDGEYAYEGATGVWTGEATSVSFTAATNQVRATSIVVEYAPVAEQA